MDKAYGYICHGCNLHVTELDNCSVAEHLAETHANATGHSVEITGPIGTIEPEATKGGS